MSEQCSSARQPLHAPLLNPPVDLPQPSLEMSAPSGPASEAPKRKQFGFHTCDLFMSFANEILSRGLVKMLDEDDIDDMLSSDEPRATRDELWVAWDLRRSQGRPSLIWSVLDCWSGLFIGSALIHVFDIGLLFVAPYMVKVLIEYNNVQETSLLTGLLYVFIFFLAPCLQAVATAHFNIHSRRLGFRIHGATACLVFEKILRLSQPTNASYGPGKLTNIMSTDTFQLQMTPFYANFLWSMPLMLITGTVLLYKNLGVAGLTPIVVTVLFYPLNNILKKKLMTMNRDLNLDRDSRIKLLTEVLHALELVKQLGWEYQIKGLVDEKRVKELKTIASMKMLGVVNKMVWEGVPALLPLATVGAFVLLGGSLDPGTIFSSLALLDLVNVPMKLFPEALQWLVQARVGVERIEQLLMAEEMKELEGQAVDLLSPDSSRLQNSPAYVRLAPEGTGTSFLTNYAGLPMCMRDADFQWASATVEEAPCRSSTPSIWQRCIWQCMINRRNQDNRALLDAMGNEAEMSLASNLPTTLSVPLLKIAHGSLVLVCGPVGSGKSTLVQGLLNEVPLITGQVQILGSAAYCAQKPWILHATVRDNILFGEAYDPVRFASVIRACALETDLMQFAQGEATVIGVRGINLSGGQKARISLARTTYAAASLNILDDPLSAVDPHVAVHLMEQCIGSSKGLLRGTTRVLVTHQLQFIHQADLIVVVSNGKVVAARPPTDFTDVELEEFGLDMSKKGASEMVEVNDAPSSPLDNRRGTAPGPTPSDCGQTKYSTPAMPSKPVTGNCQGVVTAAQGTQQGHHAPQSVNMQDGQQEDRQTGEVSAKIWWTYARAMGPLAAAALVTLYIASNGMQMASMFWLARWSASTDSSKESALFSLAVYAAFSFGSVVLMCVRMLIFRRTSLRVSAVLHEQALWAVMRSPKWWLDRTPAGRILNRFSQDMKKVDLELQDMSSMFAESILKMVVSVVLVVALVPILLVVMPPLVYLYNRVQMTFRKSSRELRRLSSLSRSPIFQNLDEVIAGVSTIRAFRKVADFVNKNAELCSRNIAMDFANSGIGRWMGMRLRFVGMAFVAAVALFLVLQSRIGILRQLGAGLSAAAAGLALRYALDLTANMEQMIQTITMTEQGLIALERLTALAQNVSESSLTMPEDADKHAWPTSGEIVFDSVIMRYHHSLPIVLKHLSFVIPGGTSVGVVGRTGSGKTSILAALFRLCKLDSGQIRIDGTDIWTLGLHTLRRKLAIIPQEAVGFTGSLRFNLDPFGERSDDEIWVELENVQMKSFVEERGLDYHLSGGGENLSAGQRQLLCAARAFLQNCRILVLDEATASVDFGTDAMIQAALHKQVRTKRMTTITVAHRINTILNSNNVLVMDSGAIAEFGPTNKLANDPDSLFYTFVCSAAAAVDNK